MKNYEYPGAIHIHTKYSDGTSTINNIAKAAQKAGLKWIIITDHNSIDGLKNNEEGYYNDVCVLIGTEISPELGNHYLAFNLDENISHMQSPQAFIKEVNKKNGFGFVAHPDECIQRDNKYPPLRWDDWTLNSFQGLEIWNYMSDWVDTLTSHNKYNKVLFPNKSLQGPTVNVMKWWDELNKKSPNIVPGIVGVDVHAFIFRFLGLPVEVFPYKQSFRTLQNLIQIDEILSKDIKKAKKQIYEAIKTGNNIMANNSLGQAEHCVYTATKINNENKFIKATVGEILKIDDIFKIDIEVPQNCLIRLIRDGKVIKENNSNKIKYETTEPGSYRFETYKNGAHWIISNPIKVVKACD